MKIEILQLSEWVRNIYLINPFKVPNFWSGLKYSTKKKMLYNIYFKEFL